jgi:hypothetical protein
MLRPFFYLFTIALVMVMNVAVIQGGTCLDLIETDFNNPDWALVTSDSILRENLCIPSEWYEKVFNPCHSSNRYWRMNPCAKEGRAFSMGPLAASNWTFDSLYVRQGYEFQLYSNQYMPDDPNELLPASPRLSGPQYVSLVYWRDDYPPPNGFEPNTFFVPGGPGGLKWYSIIIYPTIPLPCNSCQIENGSFEDNQWITDIMEKAPNHWDVKSTAGGIGGYNSFGGYVRQVWPTDGAFNLSLFSNRYYPFEVNDIITVSQDIYLTDANKITFDLKLDTYPTIYPWDPAKCTAVMLIDSDVVWKSNSVGADVRGEYRNQFYPIEDKYKDGQPHKLSLGLRMNVAGNISPSHIAHWDSIKCNLCCGGGGLLAADFSRDCCVNFIDFAMLANHWLEQNPSWPYELVEDGIVDTNDLEVFVDTWLDCSYIE